MVLLVCKGLEAFRYFSNIVLAEFGGGYSFNEMCNIIVISRIIISRNSRKSGSRWIKDEANP